MSIMTSRNTACLWLGYNYGCKQLGQLLPRVCHLLIILLLASCAVQILVMDTLTRCSKGFLDAGKLPYKGVGAGSHGDAHGISQAHLGLQFNEPRVPVANDFCLDTLTPGMFNPSIAVYRGAAWVVLRTQHVMQSSSWALGQNHLAKLNLSDWSILSFHSFDPWSASNGSGLPCKAKDTGSPIHVWGPDDTKLFVWPGRGLWALTSGRPRVCRILDGCCSCGKLVFQQHLVQLAREGEDLNTSLFERPSGYVPPDQYPGWPALAPEESSTTCTAEPPVEVGSSSWEARWGAPPLPLTITDAVTVYKDMSTVEEKNWALFHYNDTVYVSYQLAPKHRVYTLNPDGRAELMHETDSRAVFSAVRRPFQSLNGGPAIVMVNSTVATGNANGYMLGVMHYHTKVAYEDSPTYYHHLIKVAPVPPFEILELSQELKLHLEPGASKKENIAFVSGIQLLMMGPQEASASTEATGSFAHNAEGSGLQPYVVLSYGVADTLSRVRIMPMEEVEQLFVSAPWSKQSVQAGAPAVNSPATKHTIEQQILMADVAGLEKAMENGRNGATPMVWNVKHCGGDDMCTSILKANIRVFSCWSLIPSQGSLADKQKGCMCSGPKPLSMTYMPADHVVPFLERYQWVRALFSDYGMPAQPYFGSQMVQVAVVRNPITRYMLHIQETGRLYNIQELQQPNMTLPDMGSVAVNQANNLQLLVPDNYMTRFFAGHTALEDYSLLNTPVTADVYQKAIHNLNQVDMVIVLEESHSADVQEMLRVIGLKPFSRSTTDNPANAAMSDPASLPRELYEQLAARHFHDMHLYQYASSRHTRLVAAWQHIKHRQQVA